MALEIGILEEMREKLEELIVDGEDGEAYVVILSRVESEIRARQSRKDTMASIRDRVTARRGTGAPKSRAA